MPRRVVRRWTRVAAMTLPLLLAASCVAARAAGYSEGRSEASTALERGTAELCVLGMSLSSHDTFDPESGLFRSRHLGCLVSDYEEGYADGWNAFFRAAAARGELDGVSLRHKARTEEQVVAAFAADPGVEFPRDRALREPSGRFAIEISDGTVVIPTAGRDLGEILRIDDTENARVLFADGGTTAIVRWAQRTGTHHATIDLPSGRLLQMY